MKIKKIIKLGLVLLCSLFVSCKDNEISSSSSNQQQTIDAIYTISFYEDGGKDVLDIKSKANEAITLPETSKEGSEFAGWYYDYGTYDLRCEISTMPSKNITLYAKWENYTSEDYAQYDKELASYSKPGHLYIHYKRFTHTAEDYADWNLWVWAKNATGREFEWMQTSSGIKYDNYGGAVAEIDLTKTYTDGGNDKTETIKYVDSNGEIVEQGSHKQLLENGGYYSKLYTSYYLKLYNYYSHSI